MSDPFREELIDGLRSLRAFARTFHRDANRAEDLVQETMLKAWANRHRFKTGTNMRSWLFTILRNTYISEKRKTKREVEDVDGVHAAKLSEQPRQHGHLAMLDFRSALSHLNEEQREALILVGASGFSYEEAADIMGTTTGTVKSRVSRARAHMTDLLNRTPKSTAPLADAKIGP